MLYCGNLPISITKCLRLGTRAWENVTDSGRDGMTCATGRRSTHTEAPSREMFVRASSFTHTGISRDSVLYRLSSPQSIYADCTCRPFSSAKPTSSPHLNFSDTPFQLSIAFTPCHSTVIFNQFWWRLERRPASVLADPHHRRKRRTAGRNPTVGRLGCVPRWRMRRTNGWLLPTMTWRTSVHPRQMLVLFVGTADALPTMATTSAHARPMSVNAPRTRTCQLHSGPRSAPAPLPNRFDAHSMHSKFGMGLPLSSGGAPLWWACIA